MLLLLLSLIILQATETQQATPTSAEIVEVINQLRTAIATAQDAQNNNAALYLPQSDQMFKLEDNVDLAKRAMVLTLMCDDAQPPPAPYSYVYYRSRKAVDIDVVGAALEFWYNLADNDMDTNATYTSSLNNFAQVVYYKSTLAGCAVAPFPCTPGKPNGFACVFNNQPQLGEPLYPVTANAVAGTGCSTSPVSCPEVDGKPSTCNANLCEAPQDATFPPNAATTTTATTTAATTTTTTASTTTTAAATTTTSAATTTTTAATTTTTTPTTTTTTAAAGVVTKDIQDMIVLMHNNRRMMVAKGTVPNGKSGNNLPQAANMNELRYDQLLGADAQAYAESCPTSTAATINNYAYGQNVLIANTVSIAYSDLFESAIRNWFDEIYINGMNNKMNFTEFLATKPNPPTHFTQMVWADHMTVGCGAHRCGSNSVVVCRYQPGGNIVNQFVYKVGAPCSACNFGCNSALSLCTVPRRT